MASRFFVDGQLKAGTLSVSGSEFQHIVRVLRHRAGDTVVLFDGAGREAEARIEHVSRNSVMLNVGRVRMIPEEPGPRLILGVALPKLSRSATLIEKAVELGVAQLVPLRTSRAVVLPRESRLDTFRQNVIAACKQCGRGRLMDVTAVVDWPGFVSRYIATGASVVAHPGGVPFRQSLIHEVLGTAGATTGDTAAGTTAPEEDAQDPAGGGAHGETDGDAPEGRRSGDLVAAVGPEGGFTVEEISQAVTHGARLVSLGPRILRIETAAMMIASVFTAAFMDDVPVRIDRDR